MDRSREAPVLVSPIPAAHISDIDNSGSRGYTVAGSYPQPAGEVGMAHASGRSGRQHRQDERPADDTPEGGTLEEQDEGPVDGSCLVRVTDDAMRALIDLHPSRNGGRPLTLDRVRLALQEKRVFHGVNEELLRKLITSVEKSKSGKSGVIVAQGNRPEHGTDGRVEFLFSEDESVLEQEEAEDDSVVE
jgi:hypothetical protein